MTKGDRVKIHRGPLAGMVAELVRHDSANRAWYAIVAGSKVVVYDYELVETIERVKRKKEGKKK